MPASGGTADVTVEFDGQCHHLVRGKKRCRRVAEAGEEVCEFHNEREMKRQRAIRDERRSEVLKTMGKPQKADGPQLAQKLRCTAPELTMIDDGLIADPAAGRVFEKLCSGGKAMWQQSKRAWHEPQVETLAAHVRRLPQLDAKAKLVELGAGKGLLGCIVGELCGCRVALLDRREVAGEVGVDTERIHADLEDCSLDDVAGGDCVVLAKHFCGNATDLALRRIHETHKVRAAVVAPCCHPKMTFDEYCGRAHLAAMGYTRDDFAALLLLIEISRTRVQRRHELSAGFGKRMSGVADFTQEELYELGRLARRVVEEGRLRFLRETWPSARLVNYAPHSVTPDNLFILAERGAVPKVSPSRTTHSLYRAEGAPAESGVLLHLTCCQLSDLPMRVVEYLLELRDRDDASPVHVAWVADLRLPRHVSDGATTELVVVQGDPARLLPVLARDEFLGRTVDKAYPFTHAVGTLREVFERHVTAGVGGTRVNGYPKAIEREAVDVLEGCGRSDLAAHVHPTKFSTTLSVVEWRVDMCEDVVYLCSALDVSQWDPRAWPSLGAVAPQDMRGIARIKEVFARSGDTFRFPARPVQDGPTRVGLIATAPAQLLPLLEGLPGTEVVQINVALGAEGRVTWSEVNTSLDYVVVHLEEQRDDIVKVLRTLPAEVVQAQPRFVCSLKLCPTARSFNPSSLKVAHAKLAADLADHVADLHVMHLLCDKENERVLTGVIGRDGGPVRALPDAGH